YQIALEIAPQDSIAYTYLGQVYAELQDHPRAIANYENAIKTNSQNDEAYVSRALSRIVIGNPYGALDDLKFAAGLKTPDARAEFYGGMAFSNVQNWQQAIINYTHAIVLNPPFAAGIYNYRGNTYRARYDAEHNNDDLDRALEDYSQAIRLDAHFAEAYN